MNESLVLVVQQDYSDSGLIAKALADENLTCVFQPSLAKALQSLSQHRYDAMLLYKNGSGMQIEKFCRKARQRLPGLTIIACLDERQPELEERLFNAGLDDIVSQGLPPGIIAKRILLRLKNPLRKASKTLGIHIGEVIVDLETLHVWKGGSPETLSRGLARLLCYLIKNPNRPISRQEVAKALWVDAKVDPGGRNLDMQVMKLRRLIETDPKKPIFIRTIRGTGYVFLAPR